MDDNRTYTQMRVRWDLEDQRSANNSEDILRLNGPTSFPVGEVLSLWRLNIYYIEYGEEQPWLVALNLHQEYGKGGEYAILFEGSEKEAKALFYSEEMFGKYPGGERGRLRRIARHGGPGRGQGRKREIQDPTVMSFKVSGEVAHRIKERAAAEGRSYADLLREKAEEIR